MPNSNIFYAISSAVLMGTVGVFSRFMAMGAESVSFLRLALGAIFMLLFLLWKNELRRIVIVPPVNVCISGGFLAGFILFYIQAMNYTTMANAIMLVYFGPLAASIYAHVFFNEKLSFISSLLILTALLGFAMMLEFDLNYKEEQNKLMGLGYGFMAMLCYCGFILVNRRITTHIYSSTFYQLALGGLILAPFFLYNFQGMNPTQLGLALGVGLLPGFIAILFAVTALRSLHAATFGTLAYFEPFTVVILGWLIFDETLSYLQLCGCFAILLSGIFKTVLENSNTRYTTHSTETDRP